MYNCEFDLTTVNGVVVAKATGNSRSESQKFPPLSVKIPENSRYENTAYASRV